jgi:hypothetical protein
VAPRLSLGPNCHGLPPRNTRSPPVDSGLPVSVAGQAASRHASIETSPGPDTGLGPEYWTLFNLGEDHFRSSSAGS